MREFEKGTTTTKKSKLKKKTLKLRNMLSSLLGLLFFHLNLYLCAIDIGTTKYINVRAPIEVSYTTYYKEDVTEDEFIFRLTAFVYL